ncbi:MAG: SAM-dependent methyltransferase [Bacilli bacterium]|nr:SAM-dependent methyltransferase [Bacilli bacterium]
MSKRLETLESLVDTKKVFDVGCDHGLLAISLSKNHEVVASDISEACVIKTKANVEEAKAKVNVLQSDGLKELDINKSDTVIIAGMGAYGVIKILKASIDKVPNTLIIQANNNYDILRKEVTNLGYYIDIEKTLYLNRWYVIIRFKKGIKKYNKMDYLLGPDPSKEFVLFNLKNYQNTLKKIPYRYFIKRIKIKILIHNINRVYNLH